MFPPVFSRTVYTKEVLPYSRGVLRGLAAFDKDRAECSYKKHVLCPCSKVVYGILKGEDSDKFQINPDTGELAYAANNIGHETELKVIIVARNIDEFGQVIKSNTGTGHATVRIKITSNINIEEELVMREILPYPNTFNWRDQDKIIDNEQLYKMDDDEVIGNHAHSRSKRAVTINNIDLQLTNNGSNNAGTMCPSENFTFVAIVTVPVGTYDVKVEINTTLTTSRAVYQITNINIESIGSNLNTSILPISTETSSFGNNEVDSAVIYFGEVTNNGTDITTLQLSQLSIIFTLQVLGNSEITDGELYNVSSTVVHTNGTIMDSTSLRAKLITRTYQQHKIISQTTVNGETIDIKETNKILASRLNEVLQNSKGTSNNHTVHNNSMNILLKNATSAIEAVEQHNQQDTSAKLKDIRQLEQKLKKKEEQLKIKEAMINDDFKEKEQILERLFKAENRNFELEQTIKTLNRRISILETQPIQQTKEPKFPPQNNCTQSSTDELIVGVRDKVTRFVLSKIDNEFDKLLSKNDHAKDNPVITDISEPMRNNSNLDQPSSQNINSTPTVNSSNSVNNHSDRIPHHVETCYTNGYEENHVQYNYFTSNFTENRGTAYCQSANKDDPSLYCISEQCILMMDNLYRDADSKVKLEGGVSNAFNIEQGVRQGGTLSANLYEVYVNQLLNNFVDSKLVADEIAIVGNNQIDVQVLINMAYDYSKREGYLLQPEKMLFYQLKPITKIIKQVLSLPVNVADQAIYVISGLLPAEAVIHKKALILFGSICRAGYTSIEWKIEERHLGIKKTKSISWFIAIKAVFLKYEIGDPHMYLFDTTLSKTQWKNSVKQKVRNYWSSRIKQETPMFKSLKNLVGIYTEIQVNDFTVNVTMTAGILPFTYPGDIFSFEATISVPTGPNNFKIVINTTLTTNRAVFKFTSLSVTSIGSNLLPVTSPIISDVATFVNGEVDIKEIDFGQMNNTGSDMTSIEPSQIVISFTVDVVQNTEVVTGDIHNISAYVEDNGGGVIIQSLDSKQLLSNMIPLMLINDFSVSLNITGGEQPESLTPGDTFTFDVIITVPVGSFDFNVTIDSSVTSSRAVLHISSLVVAAVGTNFNISVTPIIEDSTTFYGLEVFYVLHSTEKRVLNRTVKIVQDKTDSKTVIFGTVTNTGSDITMIQPSQITLSFIADVIHNVEIKSGNVYNVSVYLNSGIGSKMDMVELMSDWSKTFTVPSSTIEIGTRDNITTVSPTQKVYFQLIVTVPVGQHNITVHLASAFNVLSIYQICTVESVVLGSNLIGDGNIETVKVSTFDNFEVDSAAIYLGIIQNSGSDTGTSFEPSEVTINFTAIVLNNANLVDGYMCDFTTSVEEDGVISNISKISLPASIHNLNSGFQPVIQVSGPTTLAPGQAAIWTITTVLVDGSSLFSLDIYGTETYPIDLCSSHFKEAGSNFYCYDNDRIKVTPSATGTSGFVYTFGELLNTDYLTNNVPANVNNSVTVQVKGSIPTDAVLGANFEFSVVTYLNGIGSTSEIQTVNVGSPTYTTTIIPVVTMSKFVNTSEDITKGSTVLVVIDLFVQPNTVDAYSLQVTTSVGISTICDVRILLQGDNLPCAKIPETYNCTVYASVDGNKTFSSASLDLGLVSNLAVSTDIMNNDNKISIGVAVQVLLNSSATTGDIITVTANILSDNMGQVTTSLAMPVTDTIILEETNTSVLMISLPPTTLPVIVKISETVSWKVQLYFPVTSDRFQITAHTPVSGGEGHLTVMSAKYIYIGAGLSCGDFLEILSVSSLSDVSNQQMTKLDLDLGFLSYLGLSNTTDENMLEIEFNFKVTDHSGNTDGSVQTITFDLISDSGVMISATGDVTLSVLGSEMTKIQLDTWCDDTFLHQAMSGEDITIYGNLTLQNTSTAHASNVKFSFLLPHYITFVTLLNCTHVQPVITEDVKGVTLTFPLVTFEDMVEFSFNVSLDPSGWFDPGSVDVYTVLIVDVTYMSLQRPDRTDTAIHYFPEPFILEISFDVLESLVPIGPLLQSCQWVGSSEEKPHSANTSLSSSSLGWRPSVRGEPFCGKEFLEIDLGNKWKVSKLLVYSVGDDNLDYITQFIVQTSNTGITWTSIFDNGTTSEKIFSVNFDNNNKQVNDAFDIMLGENEIFTSRYIRVIPKSATVKVCRPGLRIEVQGVKKTNDYTGNCNTTASRIKDVEKRTLLVDQIKGTIFACMETEESQDVLCSITEDLGQTWEGIDDKVANVIGVIANSSTVLGISEEGISYVCSYNNGFEWDMCSDDEASDIISDPNYTIYKIIPFADLTSLSVFDWKTKYGFTYDNKDITGSISGVIVDSGGSVKTIAWWGTSDWSTEL
ncbi:unnamed protein product [Mytilus coruscus]|uniref:F5/8 type C domain-containing protein n=1 Tax=Mytilus coruscus TaxID=42192 RepID=A0A6J8D1G2_MYTCO|nr:unnamed protein product [Mytilus coruscus]